MPLTHEQRQSLWEPDGSPTTGPRIVSARPGTGKTTTLTEYCIDVSDQWNSRFAAWQGMALVSYTNVAKDELEQKIRVAGRARRLLSTPHFVGTLDSFINQYIFLPFGATYMGYSGGRPKLVGEPYSQWRPWGLVEKEIDGAYSPVFFDCYSLGVDGRPFVISAAPRKIGGKSVPTPTGDQAKILKLKQHVWQKGYALQTDANYIADAVLAASERLTKALVGRFPMLIIDEAQDMTEVQHALIDRLRAAGLKQIVLIGDEYQAIYEWNTARPQLFLAKAADPAWNSKTIADTFRCSPAICTTLTKMAGEGAALHPAPSGKNASYAEAVEVRAYDASNDKAGLLPAIDDLASLLTGTNAHDGNAENEKTLAVVTRSREDMSRIQAHLTGGSMRPTKPISWNDKLTKDYLRVVFRLHCGDKVNAVGAYETLLFNAGDYSSKSAMRAELMHKWSTNSFSTLKYRVLLFEDLTQIAAAIPKDDGLNISGCEAACAVALRGLSASIMSGIRRDCRGFLDSAKQDQDRPIESLFAARDERIYHRHAKHEDVRITVSTVHGVKGETYDGVLFYTKGATGTCGCTTPRRAWKYLLQHDLAACEEKRIAYVALSRAAQVLLILAPEETAEAWQSQVLP